MEDDLTEAIEAPTTEEDIATSIISKYNNSTSDHHLHLCTVVASISHELKDQHLNLSPLAYFAATLSSLDRLYSDSTSSPLSIDALLFFLDVLLPHVSIGILRSKKRFVLDVVFKVLRSGSRSVFGIASGVKCLGLMICIDGGCWSDVEPFYGFLLGFLTHSNPQVRRESHQCIRDVLQSFQGSPFLAPASEGFTNTFRRVLLLDGASKGDTAEREAGASKAHEILYVLEALKDCLPYISLKYRTAILKNYKNLLGLHQPLVTRRITDSLNIVCLHPTLEVSADVLVDILGTLALSVPAEETSADGLTFTARLLDVGMRKVLSINRETCINKLTVVLNALQDIFGSGFEEAKFAAADAMKNLIEACIDEELIKQGTDRLINNSGLKSRNSAPSVIEKICAIVGSLVDNRYRDEWDLTFQVVSLMFDKLGKSSSLLLRGTLENLASLEKENGENFQEQKQLRECLGSALQAMGPEVFLSILPLNLKADNLSDINVWIFPILKQYTIGARLRFYAESLLGLVAYLKQKSHKLNVEGQVQASRAVDSLAHSVWSLLPSFCNYPVDTASSFTLLKKALCDALNNEPDLRGIICFSLRVLIQQNKCIVEGNNYVPSEKLSSCTERAIAFYNQEVASANLAVLRSSAQDFLRVLSIVFSKSSSDPGGSLLSTVGEFASIADKDVVGAIFRKTMHRLLQVTRSSIAKDASNSMQIDDDSSSRARAQLFDLAVSLLPGLGAEEIDLLYTTIVSALKDADGLVQKKAYKVLSVILKNSEGLICRKLEELLKLMIEVLPSCHFSAKRHRLDCLYHLIVYVAKDEADQKKGEIISSFLTEIVLALKEVNKKTRNRAYDILVQIGHTCGDEERGGNREDLLRFFNMVAGGLAGETPHMISAAVKGLARLAYEFSDLIATAYNILPSSFLLLQRKNREIIKANLGLVKVLIAKSSSENLQNHLNMMVEGLLKWQNETKNHFKAKVKNLLEMLVKKCGVDAVKAVMPEEHMKLLTNIRKIKERKERKLATNSETRSYLSKATTSRLSEWGHTKIFSDFSEEGSDGDYMDAETATGRRSMRSSNMKSKASSLRSRKTRKSGKASKDSFHELGDEDEPLDLLDQRRTREALRLGALRKRKLDSDDEPEFDDDGRLIIREENKSQKPENDESVDYESDEDIKSKRSTHVVQQQHKNSKKTQKRQKTSDSGWAYTGNEYASKKARGDVKKKGKLEPYAYWPLDRKLLSRRSNHKVAARRGMASVVKLKKLEGKSVANALSLNQTRRSK